jgi:hypothetical protein
MDGVPAWGEESVVRTAMSEIRREYTTGGTLVRAGVFSPGQSQGVCRNDAFQRRAGQAPGSGDERALTLKGEE